MTDPSEPAAASGPTRPLRRAVEGFRLAAPGPTVLAVALCPDLWGTALRLGWRMAIPGWWRRWPASPMPPAAYVAFRSETMLGATTGSTISPHQVVAYLQWCRRMRSVGG